MQRLLHNHNEKVKKKRDLCCFENHATKNNICAFNERWFLGGVLLRGEMVSWWPLLFGAFEVHWLSPAFLSLLY